MEKRCDLHVHSSYSDGTMTPQEIVALAAEESLAAVALTDHNTVKGNLEFLEAAKDAGIIGVSGIEITTQWREKEIHLLGLFLPSFSLEEIEKTMEQVREQKQGQYVLLVENLKRAGVDISYEEVVKKNPNSFLNRAHFATELMEKGYVSSVKEAFTKYLDPKCGYYTPAKRPDTLEMIAYLRERKGVPVIAHPMISLEKWEIPAFADQVSAAGVAGMETLYSEYSKSQQDYITHVVRSHGLEISGGSDFHGTRKPDIHLGRGLGRLKVPFSVCENLKKWQEKNLLP